MLNFSNISLPLFSLVGLSSSSFLAYSFLNSGKTNLYSQEYAKANQLSYLQEWNDLDREEKALEQDYLEKVKKFLSERKVEDTYLRSFYLERIENLKDEEKRGNASFFVPYELSHLELCKEYLTAEEAYKDFLEKYSDKKSFLEQTIKNMQKIT